MGEPFHLTVLTPEQVLLEVQGVTRVQAQLADGSPIGIYPGHAPLLAETVAAPLHYTDASGEHALDLCAGILQVGDESVTVFARPQTSRVSETLEVSENDSRFDRLAHELLANPNAQPDEVLDIEKPVAGDGA
jgi:F0F1-type ATP synthase epsilon subunit